MEQLGNLTQKLKLGLTKSKYQKRLRSLARLPSTSDLVSQGADEETVERARERDSLQASRPPGCWCLGLGYLGAITYDDDLCMPTEICPVCEEGQAAQREADRVWAEYQERIWQKEEQKRKKWENAGIPRRFKDLSLDTFPLQDEYCNVIGDLRGPGQVPDDADAEEIEAIKTQRAKWEGAWFLYGPFGSGKTGLAVSYARERVRRGLKGSLYFVTVPSLLGELKDTYKRDSEVSEQDVIDRYARVGLLIMDDLGAEHVKDTGWLEDRLYQVIGERHDQMRDTIFTSNLDLEELAKDRIGERVTWRILEMCGPDHVVRIDRANLRDYR